MSEVDTHRASSTGREGPRRIVGDDARALIEEQLAAHSGGIRSALSPYRMIGAVQSLHETIRATEEFINIPLFGMKDASTARRLLSISIDDAFIVDPAPTLEEVRRLLAPCFEVGVVQRYLRMLLQIGAIGLGFRMHGQSAFGAGVGLDSVGAAVGYFQSRRRHLVSLLYGIPAMCTGREELAVLDTLNVLLPQIEHSCTAVTGFHQKLALLDTFDDFSLDVDEQGALSSHGYETLDDYFLEPERASILAMIDLRPNQITLPPLEQVDPTKIFSATELRNNVKLLRAVYAGFDLDDSDFSAIAQLVIAFSRHCRDDYFVELPKPKFQAMIKMQTRLEPAALNRLLVNAPLDYATNTNAYEPFIDVGDVVVSNVNLLTRFLYFFKNLHLESKRRFQIHGGFIFEDMVRKDLERLRFDVTDIKRLNRKEFDVVATRDGVIHNFQCKNNWVDLAKVEAQRKLFVRYNRSLVRYYRRALAKEKAREHLLKQALSLSRVEHYIISRFPVICADDRIINYNRIDQLRDLAGVKV